MFVLGEERDIVRLRTNIRREQVYMYRLRLPPQDLRRRLLDYVRRIEILADQPAWYNSVTSNCTTNLFGSSCVSGGWRNQQFDQRTQQRFAPLSYIVNELEEPQVKG
jgi:hypothetical protein